MEQNPYESPRENEKPRPVYFTAWQTVALIVFLTLFFGVLYFVVVMLLSHYGVID